MSGGVDSSVAACLLLRAGYNVMGVFMRLHDNYQEAEMAARAVCAKLKIKFYPISAKESFEREVVDYFTKSYMAGITPNPCVVCNKAIKFGVLLKLMQELEADYLATGHYVARQQTTDNRQQKKYNLLKGIDKEKDQSYFLYTLTQEQLKYLLFPLGEYTKEEIKKIARQENLPTLKTESQDVCFLVNEGKIVEHNDFLKKRLKLKPGDIRILSGEKIGEHKGLPLYTIGQRKGVEIGGIGPYYVARCDYKTNTLYVVNDPDDPALYSDKFLVNNVNWISGKEPKMPYDTKVVIRYRHSPVVCKVKSCKVKSNSYLVELKKPVRAITSGQSAVFYDNDEVIGGGIISNRAD
ncbi:tRNA 2-thiouridine(34) synthase MnmA [Candidatus Parcubacteria bacterium]|nr:tRNA 2-thiouridine(34) synthase MnmA [Candidatus Parcubacteria bacterium]